VSAEIASLQPIATVQGLDRPAARILMRRHHLRWWEALPWLAAVAF